LGVEQGAFGLAEVRDDAVDPETLRYKSSVPLDAVTFEPGVVMVEKSVCEALQAQMAPQMDIVETPEPPVETGVRETVAQPGVRVEPTVVDAPTEERYRRVRLVISGVPASKIADVNRGILMPLNRAMGDFTFTIEIDVSGEGGLSASTLEQKIKETVRQIGAQLRDVEVET
jgi:hypothetical protein